MRTYQANHSCPCYIYNISRDIATVLGSHFKHNNTLQELIISWNNTTTTLVYTCTNEWHVNSIWPYPICYNKTEFFVRKYSSLSSWPRSDYYLNTTGPKQPDFYEADAILLVSLAHGSTQLSIVNKNVFIGSAKVINNFVEKNKILQELKLSHNKISTYAIKLNMEAIQANTTLQILDISSNKISDDGAVAISECLKHNKTLKVLDISDNNIIEGVNIIAESIQQNTTLLKLFFCDNKIIDNGAVAISKCLTKNSTLQELGLSWISRNTKGITKIAEAISVNTGLHTLDLSSQHVVDPVDFTMTLLIAMDYNHTMMRIVLPTSVNKNEAMIKSKLDKINEERIKEGTHTIVLDIKAA